ncbi:DUF3710 domain-containing protein [Corynebacterium gerontici]|uniref:DUF3710 domain-containing protein n=1 Tax=Corynebacterium gerontici TaxID=2079234 RepID=A0A3G6J0K7_9CORY|nr:DUF3710 domain-containing protein [Corynebacterium gerontici]AZA11571.1 hypothetical protein CGERO_06355 [Corynebacterium gerontici]
MGLWPFGKRENEEQPSPASFEHAGPAEAAVDSPLAEDEVDTQDQPYEGRLGADGPFDAQEHEFEDFDFSDFSQAALNLGSMVIALPKEAQVQVEMGETGPRMLHILSEYGRFTPVAFAAPASGGQWRKLAKETTESMRNDGLLVTTEQGPFGREIIGRLDAEQSNIVRVIGADGPRWMLRVTVAAPEASAEQAAELAREMMARTFVNRGDAPILAGESLPVALPAPLAAQVQQELQRRQQQATEQGQASE